MSIPLSRRQFLGIGSLALGAWVGGPILPWVDHRRPLMDALLEAFLPTFTGHGEVSPLIHEVWGRLEQAVAPRLRQELGLSLRLLDRSPLFWFDWRPFSALPLAGRDRVLEGWQRGDWSTGRRALMAWQRAVLMGAFGSTLHHDRIGFDGPWVGHLDVGLGPDNRGDMAEPVNPNALAPFDDGAWKG